MIKNHRGKVETSIMTKSHNIKIQEYVLEELISFIPWRFSSLIVVFNLFWWELVCVSHCC
jgi:hypothetical protein